MHLVHFQCVIEIVGSTECLFRDPVWIMLMEWLKSYFELTN